MERCPVCGAGDCRSHSHIGPLQRALGGRGLDAKPAKRVVVGRKKRSKRGPSEDRMRHGPVEDRSC